MVCLVDTCGWIEWLIDGVLADVFEPYLQHPAEIVVPTTLQFELYKWAKREKGELKALGLIALTEQGRVLSLNSGLSLFAADLALKERLGVLDEQHVPLITADDHFKDLPGVVYFSKKSDLS